MYLLPGMDKMKRDVSIETGNPSNPATPFGQITEQGETNQILLSFSG
jgi:hypothetical protein